MAATIAAGMLMQTLYRARARYGTTVAVAPRERNADGFLYRSQPRAVVDARRSLI